MRKHLRGVRFAAVALLAGLVGLVLPAAVRGQNAGIAGTVSDTSHSIVEGAKVSATSVETNATKSTQTNETGGYRLVDLAPGTYEVVVEKDGFKTLKMSQVVLTVGQNLTLDVTLEVGSVSATVEVSGGETPTVEMDTASISNVVDQRHINDLPLITRDPYQLVLLSPGVVQSNTSNGGFSVNGQRDRNNNFLLDGVDNNDTDVPGIPGGITSLNPDSAQEFRVITDNYLPEYGRNSGAIIEVITKSGTNTLHGDAYWFGRYNAQAARDFFNHNIDDLTGKVEGQNPFVRNIFGGSAGGPIIKDKTFWFANYDGSRFVTSLTNQTVVPTAAFKSGQFTFNGTPVDFSPSSSQNATGAAFGLAQGLPLDPTIQSILALYPGANAGATAVDDVRGLYRFGSSSRSNSDNFTVKVDHNLTEKELLSVRYTFNRFTDPNPFHSDFLPGLDSVSTYQRTQSASINLISTISTSFVNELRVGGNRTNLQFSCNGTSVLDGFSTPDAFGRGTDFSLAGLNDFGCGTLGDSNGQSRFTGTYTFGDSFTWLHGNHSMKFGGEHRRVYSNSFNAFGSRTADSFNVFSTFLVPSINLDPNTPCDPAMLADPAVFAQFCGSVTLQNMGWMLTGVLDQQFQAQFFNKGGTRTANDLRGFRQREMRLFAQDVWKVRSNLTVTYGLAWQYYGVPFEVNNNFSNLFQDPSGTAPFTFTIVGPGSGAQVYDDYYKDFEPRIGIAWDPQKKGKMSIRAGYGISHDRVFGNLIGNARSNPPFEQDFFAFVGDILPDVGNPDTQKPSAIVDNGAFLTPVLFDKRYRVPEVQSWSLGIQRELPGNVTVEASYTGSHTVHLFRQVDGNPPQPALVAGLIASGVDPALLAGSTLWTGGTNDDPAQTPFPPAVNNNAFFQAFLQKSIANASYNGLKLKVTQRTWHGLQWGVAYTYAHAIDNASDPLTPAAGNRAFPRNSFNLAVERGNSDFDIRHRAVINYLYELPFGRGKNRWSEGFRGKVLEGWQVSGITTLSKGLPFDVFGNVDGQHTGLSDRAEVIGNTALTAKQDDTQTGPNPAAFRNTVPNEASNLTRNHFYGPGFVDFDAVAQKSTTLNERLKLVFRTEFYNLFNHPNFGQPDNQINDTNTFSFSLSQIGRPDGTSGARQLQFALKLVF